MLFPFKISSDDNLNSASHHEPMHFEPRPQLSLASHDSWELDVLEMLQREGNIKTKWSPVMPHISIYIGVVKC